MSEFKRKCSEMQSFKREKDCKNLATIEASIKIQRDFVIEIVSPVQFPAIQWLILLYACGESGDFSCVPFSFLVLLRD